MEAGAPVPRSPRRPALEGDLAADRLPRHHARGALAERHRGLRTPFEPLVPDVIHVRNTNRYRRPHGETEEEFTAMLLEELQGAIEQADRSTVAMVIMEPVQNSGRLVHASGRLLPRACASSATATASCSAPTR